MGRGATVRRAALGAGLAVALFALLAVPVSHPAAAAPSVLQDRPLPDEERFLQSVRENLARATSVQGSYAYKERRTELHLNPFGRIGSGGTLLYDVVPFPDGTGRVRTLLERNGMPAENARPERQQARSRRQAKSGVDDAVAALRFWIDGREHRDGRDLILVGFEPRPEAEPSTREGRVAKVMKGTIWIDEAEREVIRAEATAVDDLSFGLGMIARLNEGSRVTLRREPVDDVWMPTSIRFVGDGRAMLFRKLRIDHVIEWFDYRRVASIP